MVVNAKRGRERLSQWLSLKYLKLRQVRVKGGEKSGPDIISLGRQTGQKKLGNRSPSCNLSGYQQI